MSEPRPRENDLIDDMAEEVARRWPHLAQADVEALVLTLRQRWGGSRPYIGKRLGVGITQRNQAILAARSQGMGVADIARRIGCTINQVERALGWK
jgi:hypothetical protein